MERARRERSPMERKSGCRTSSSRTRGASNACCTDRRFCNRTHRPYFAKFPGVPGKISSYSGKYSKNKFPEEPCMRTVGSRKRRTVSHLISYQVRIRTLHTVCSNNFVWSTEVEPAATVRRRLISYATGTRVGRKSLYRLKQSPRNWHGTVQHELITQGFKACMCDPCVYVKDDSSSKVFIMLYLSLIHI